MSFPHAARLSLVVCLLSACSSSDEPDVAVSSQTGGASGAAGAAPVTGGSGGAATAGGAGGSGGALTAGGNAGSGGGAVGGVTGGTSGPCGAPTTLSSGGIAGVYRVTSYTQNKAGCTTQGKPYASGAVPYLVLWFGDFVGKPALKAVDCKSPSDCAAKAKAMPNSGALLLSLPAPDATSACFEESGATSGYPQDGLCKNGGLVHTKLELLADGMLRYERTLAGANYPSPGGSCDTGSAKQAAAGAPCSSLDVIEATLVQP